MNSYITFEDYVNEKHNPVIGDFFKKATEDEKAFYKELIKKDKHDEAETLVQTVTGKKSKSKSQIDIDTEWFLKNATKKDQDKWWKLTSKGDYQGAADFIHKTVSRDRK